jgi:hypothetical protein
VQVIDDMSGTTLAWRRRGAVDQGRVRQGEVRGGNFAGAEAISAIAERLIEKGGASSRPRGFLHHGRIRAVRRDAPARRGWI